MSRKNNSLFDHGTLYSFLSFLSGICLIVFLAAASIQSVVFSRPFYRQLYDDLNLSQTTGVSTADLENAIFAMADYVSGAREDLAVTVTWQGEERSAFNEKEIQHMADVKNLWLAARNTGYACLILFLAWAAFLIWKTGKFSASYLCRGFVQALLFSALLIGSIGLYAMADFTAFWTQFHQVFFTNDLWLLDPATDFMIVICPEEMFTAMITRIVLQLGILCAALGGFSLWYVKRKAPLGLHSILTG